MNILKRGMTGWGECFFVLLVSLIALVISFYPSIYEIQNAFHAFPDRYFMLVHNFAPDYHAYLSKIIQGLQGHWLVREYFTSEPHKGSLLQIFYLVLGLLGRAFTLTAEEVYHVSRIVFGLGWLIAGWFFIKFSFTNKIYRKIAFLLFVFVGNWPKIVDDPNGYGFWFLDRNWETTMVGWSNLDIVKRITFIPHWNAGHILTVLSLLFFIKYLNTNRHSGERSDSRIKNGFWTSQNDGIKKTLYLLTSAVFGLLAGFVLPPTLIIVYTILGFWVVYQLILSLRATSAASGVAISSNWFLRLLRRPAKSGTPRNDKIGESSLSPANLFISLFVYLLITFPSLLYNVWVTQFYPWKALVETDLYVNKIVFPYGNYLVGLGPTAFLGMFGIFIVLFCRKEKLSWSAYWVMGMFLLIFVFDKLIFWHDQTRFIAVGPELPLAVLSVVSLSFLAQTIYGLAGPVGRLVGRRFSPASKNDSAKTRQLRRPPPASLIIVLTFLLLLPSLFLIVVSVKAQTDFIDHKLGANYPSLSFGNFVVYPTRDFMEGVKFLAENTSENDVIVSGPTSGNHIAAYAGRFVYIGHGSQTVRYYQDKLPNTVRFYSGNMTDREAQKFLADNRITDVFFGPEEKTWSDWVRKRPYLELVYINGEVRIYKVN